MGDAIEEERMKAGITEKDFPDISGRWVPVKDDLDVFFHGVPHNNRPSQKNSRREAPQILLTPRAFKAIPLTVLIEFIINTIDQGLPASLDYILRYTHGTPFVFLVTGFD